MRLRSLPIRARPRRVVVRLYRTNAPKCGCMDCAALWLQPVMAMGLARLSSSLLQCMPSLHEGGNYLTRVLAIKVGVWLCCLADLSTDYSALLQ